MFGFLKNKLKEAIGKFSKDVEKDAVVETKEVAVEKTIEKKPLETKKVAEKKPVQEKSPEVKKVEKKPELKEEVKKPVSKTIEKKESVSQDKKPLPKKIEEVKPQEKIIPVISKKIDSPIIKPIEKKEEHQKIETKTPEKEFSVKEVPIIKTPEPVAVKAPEKKSFFQKIFGKSEEKPVEKTSVKKDSTQKQTLDKTDSKESKRSKEKATPKTSESVIEKEAITTETPSRTPQEKEIETILKEEIATQEINEKSTTVAIEKEEPKQEPEEKKGFFTKITETFTKFNLSEERFEELFWELEVVLLENNVAVEVIDKIKKDMKHELMKDKISRNSINDIIINTLRNSLIELFDIEKIDLSAKIAEKRKTGKPYIITIIGVNGSGKTTSIAKLTHHFKKQGLSVVLAAADTFRAAAIQQLEEHANKLDVKLIKHDYNADPAAVGFDAIKYAEAKHIDVVIIDTAGRLHSNTNLMTELKKVIRVCTPDIKIFVGESITGNDCVEQAKEFDSAVGIDAIILAKADVDDKGGAAISVSYVTKRPILFLGTGQTYDDLKEFDSKVILESLEL